MVNCGVNNEVFAADVACFKVKNALFIYTINLINRRALQNDKEILNRAKLTLQAIV